MQRRRRLQAGPVGQETWEWDGADWVRRGPGDPEEDGDPANAVYLAYDTHRGRGVLLDEGDETWEWAGGATARPGQPLPVDTPAARWEGAVVQEALEVVARAGGVGHPGGLETPGTALMAWREGMWPAVDTNDRGADQPGELRWGTADPEAIRALFFGDRRTLSFAIAPTADNGTGTAEVAVDYVEVRLRYRLDPEGEVRTCRDGLDNDQDGLVDCQEPGCATVDPEDSLLTCLDGLDNDCDGLVDCDDPGCACPP